MTSTNFYIGLGESKNSSRVLKPSGGGHTDIFGIREDNEIQTPNKRKNYPPSTINSCFVHEETNTKPNNNDKLNEKEDIQNGNQNGVKTDVTDENAKPKEVNENKEEKEKTQENVTVVPPSRVRVPPGGFSSGFW